MARPPVSRALPHWWAAPGPCRSDLTGPPDAAGHPVPNGGGYLAGGPSLVKRIFRSTIDVSDLVPVTLGENRFWTVPHGPSHPP